MFDRFLRGLAVAFLCGSAPLALTAQEPGTQQPQPPPQELPAEVQGWIAEMQQIQTQLQPIHEQALQDPEMEAARQETTDAVHEAMVAADPGMNQVIERMESLVAEAEAAQTAGDADRLAELTAEAQDIQPRYAQAQVAALEQPEVASRIEAFQGQLQQKMTEIDPSAEGMIQRLQELDQRVTAALSNAPTP